MISKRQVSNMIPEYKTPKSKKTFQNAYREQTETFQKHLYK